MVNRDQRPAAFRFPPVQSVPDWAAQFFSLAELRAFYDAVEDALFRRVSWFEVREGYLIVHPPTGDVLQCGLYNVALTCSTARVEDYPAVVEAHFARIFASVAPELAKRAARTEKPTFAEVRGALKIRIYNDAFLARPGEPPLQRKLAQGLNAVVVLDYPNLSMGVQPSMLRDLGGTVEDAFACAIENCRDLPCERKPLPLQEETGFVLMSDGHFVTSQVLHLERHFSSPPLGGALVAMPTRHTMMVCPVEPATVQDVIGGLHFVARNLFRDAAAGGEAARLSKNLYWWAGGELTYVPVLKAPGGGSAVVVPPEFIERMLAAGLPHRGATA